MSVNAPISKNNPLTSYMRQPKIYITLPSGGKYWPAKSIEIPENGELPVYSMTAKDELMFKTPDALLNGQAIVDVIQSCIPDIKNAWVCPTIDIDAIFIALRLATYGEIMPMKTKVPVINEETEFELDLRNLLDDLQSRFRWEEAISIADNLTVYVKPLTYKHMTQISIKSFESNRILNLVNDDNISDDKKLELFNTSFVNLTQITVDLMADSVYKIETAEGEVTDLKFIREFVSNSDKSVFEMIKTHLDTLKSNNEIKPMRLGTTLDQQAEGAPQTFEVPINFNNSDFFG
jgi:hypothetical protein